MEQIPKSVNQYLEQIIVQEKIPFFIRLDSDGIILDWGGEKEHFANYQLIKKKKIDDFFPFFTGMFPLVQSPIILPCVELENGVFSDIHVFSIDTDNWALFLDASDYEKKLRHVLQKRNESRLLLDYFTRIEKDVVIFDLLANLNIAVFQFETHTRFNLIGKPPEWLSKLVPKIRSSKEEIVLADFFPFIEVFLNQAVPHWNKNDPKQLLSDIWTESGDDDAHYYLQAGALTIKNLNLLLIELIELEKEDRIAILQKARQKSLDFEYLEKTEKKLRESEARLRVIIKNIPAILWTTDQDLNITSFSGSKLKFMFLDEDDHNLSISWEDFLKKFQDQTIASSVHQIALVGVSGSFETQFCDIDLYCYIEPLYNEFKQVEGIIGLGFDIAERKKVEKIRLRMNEAETKAKLMSQANQKIRKATLDTIHRLTRASEFRDKETGEHIQRLSYYSMAIAREMGLNSNIIEAIRYAVPMHDVGKIGIPDNILLKPGPLSPEEWVIMRKHTIMGAEILEGAKTGFVRLGEIIALTHHEKWDGTGYPNGLKGKQIPLISRIVALSDVFDALCSHRPYKVKFSLEKSFDIIQQGSGSHFDPKVVEAFFAIKDEIIDIYNQNQDS